MLTAVGRTNTAARDTLAASTESPIVDSTSTTLTEDEIGHGLLDVEAAVGGSDGGPGDTSPPTISNPTATDDTDADGIVGDGDRVTVSADVSDAGGVGSVTADASAFGASSTLSMIDGDADGTYTATFLVDATTASADGDYPITITATDAASNTATADTDALTLRTGSGGGTSLAIDEFTVTSLSPNNPHADVEMTWQVSGSTGVTLELTDGTDVHTWDVASRGTETYTEKHTSKTYDVTLTASNGTDDVAETKRVEA